MEAKKLAAYIRLSKEDIDLALSSSKVESNSVSHQRKLLRDYYDSHKDLHDYEFVEFVDDGFTGTNFERPQFDAMLRRVRTGEIQCIMVKDLSRFGRNYLEVGNYLDMILPLYGTRFISVTDQIDTDNFRGLTGGMDVALRNLINSLYSVDLSKKVKSAFRTRNRRGEYGGQGFYGYKLDPQNRKHLVVDEEVRPVIKMIYSDCINGLSQRQIAIKLNELGIPSPAEHKRQHGVGYNGNMLEGKTYWVQGVVRRVLTDERYTGKMVAYTREAANVGSRRTVPIPREDWIVVPGTHEAIISDDDFQLVQQILRGRQKKRNYATAPYKKSSIFVCGYCGRRLQKNTGTAHNYLRCPKADTVKGIPCERVHPTLEVLEDTILALLRKQLRLREGTLSIKATGAGVARVDRLRADRKRAADEISRINGRKADLYEKYRSGQLSKESYLRIREHEAQALKNADEVIRRCNEEERIEMTRKQMSSALENVQTDLFAAYDGDMVSQFINEVKVFGDGTLEVQFAFCE